MKYRRREIVHAIQFNEDYLESKVIYQLTFDWISVDLTGEGNHSHGDAYEAPYIDTWDDGWQKIRNGDYVVTDVNGHRSVMKEEEFENMYEKISE